MEKRERTSAAMTGHPLQCRGRSLLALGALLFVIPILVPGDSRFFCDPPMFLLQAYGANLKGALAKQVLLGNFGAEYHPLPIWILQAFLKLSHNLITLTVIKTIISVGITMAALYACRRSLRVPRLLLALPFLSPYFYIYHRELWDNVWLIPAASVFFAGHVAWAKRGSRVGLMTAMASACFMFHIHPMCLMMLVAWFLTMVTLHLKSLLRAWRVSVPAAVVSTLICLPYGLSLGRNMLKGNRNPDLIRPMGKALSEIWGGAQNLSGFSFFGNFHLPADLWGDGVRWGITGLTALVAAGVIASMVLGAYLVCRQIYGGVRGSRLHPDAKIGAFVLLAIAMHVGFFIAKRFSAGPHYSNAIWVMYLYLYWQGMRLLAAVYRRRARWVRSVLLLKYAAMLVLLLAAIGIIHSNGGNRYPHYAATLSNQISLAKAIVQYAPPPRSRFINDIEIIRRWPGGLQVLTTLYAPVDSAGRPAALIRITYLDPDPSSSDGRIKVEVVKELP